MTLYIHQFYNGAFYASGTKFPCNSVSQTLVSWYFNGSTLVRMGPKYYHTPAEARADIEAAGYQAEDNYIF